MQFLHLYLSPRHVNSYKGYGHLVCAREKTAAQERAERERQELAKRKERELKIQKELELLKDLVCINQNCYYLYLYYK